MDPHLSRSDVFQVTNIKYEVCAVSDRQLRTLWLMTAALLDLDQSVVKVLRTYHMEQPQNA
jgi:hypothetical protein